MPWTGNSVPFSNISEFITTFASKQIGKQIPELFAVLTTFRVYLGRQSNSMYSGNKGFNTELGAHTAVERASQAEGVEIKETVAEGQRS